MIPHGRTILGLLALLAVARFVAIGATAAPLDAAEPASSAADGEVRETPLTDDDFRHWAFRPLVRPPLPKASQPNWARTPIDLFIRHKQELAGAEPLEAAPRHVWLRRLSFDLKGLPPRPDDLEDCLADRGPDAVERQVDRWLASPAYGQRWAQHWLDVARFAETDGFEHDLVRPAAWRYRDWVIDALNADLGYDEFARQQLAGDLISANDPRSVVATGFLLCGPDMPDLNLQEERRHVVLNEMTATVGSVFLGLQFGCAECHDHKYDPLSQADFYRLRAFFEPLDIFRDHPLPGTPPDSPLAKSNAFRGVKQGLPRPSHFYLRGDFRQAGSVVSPAFPRIADRSLGLTVTPPDTRRADGATAPLSRLELARWLTSSDRGLFVRVAVNRVWQEHFGRGLVASPSDLGLMGEAPTHPELLDWLATEFPRRDWSLKQLHRLLVLSSTYAQSSWRTDHQRQGVAMSPEKRRDLLVGMSRRRLDGEAIRDTLLTLSGHIVNEWGGPGIRPPLPTELTATLLKNQWEVSPRAADHARRSVYLFVRRNLRFPLFEAFDRPDTNASCPVRNRSTTAPQALVLFNSQPTLQAARGIADVVERMNAADDRQRVAALFTLALGRAPTEAESQSAIRFVEDSTARARANVDSSSESSPKQPEGNRGDPLVLAAWTDLSRALLNLNEFVYVD